MSYTGIALNYVFSMYAIRECTSDEISKSKSNTPTLSFWCLSPDITN